MPTNETSNNNIFLENNEQNTSISLHENYDSPKALSSMVNLDKEIENTVKDILTKLGDGHLSNDLTSQQRNEYIKQLETNKQKFLNSAQETINALSKDITKLKSYRISSNVTDDPYKEIKRENINQNDQSMYVD
ncbi:hypothetical protein ACU28_15115 [Listeria monocytogenes]|nr:hypothetical protein [Listeria monocytogenes]